MEYKRLGDYIREVNVRNRELKVTNLLGLSIEKKFIPSIANTIGTDMSAYKIVQPSQFAYVPVTSRNGDKITVALYDGEDAAIISQAYTIFEIIDHKALLPEYLMMWFRRPEFDRYARFHSHGSAREVFDWDELCNVMLPVPDIARQREIVAEYETLSNRIRLNEQMIAKLEATAQALYRKMFVDGVDKENLPEIIKYSKIGDLVKEINERNCLLKIKRTMGVTVNKYFIPTAAKLERTNLSNYKIVRCGQFACSLIQVSRDGKMPVALYVDKEPAVVSPAYTVFEVSDTGLQSEYLMMWFRRVEFDKEASYNAVGGIRGSLDWETFKEMKVPVPPLEEQHMDIIFHAINLYQQENLKLTELQSLLLARMGK